MKIFFTVSSFNGLSQRIFVELKLLGHEIHVHQLINEKSIIAAVENFQPQLVIAPFLKKAIPEAIWKNYICLIVHPGIRGDRGAYSLDWAIMNNDKEWGVTLLQANEEMDGGDIWAYRLFKVRELSSITKGNIYRHEITQAAIECILEAIEKFKTKKFKPTPLDYNNPEIKGRLHAVIKQEDRIFNWNDTSESIIRKIKAADSSPGILTTINNNEYFVYGAHLEEILRGHTAGKIIARRYNAICMATGNGAIWLTHLKPKNASYKIEAAMALPPFSLDNVPISEFLPFNNHYQGIATFREISYTEKNKVGYLHFDFYNGAMSTEQCYRLLDAFKEAVNRSTTKVLVLMGGSDIWSNGIHLNMIEHAESPADESWKNINAINDFVKEVINTTSKVIISAMQGNAGAGGVIMALAADKIYARKGIILNPHYKKMGGLYGSEYWTYLLPQRVGNAKAFQLTDECMPVSTQEAKVIGLIDNYFGENGADFCEKIRQAAEKITLIPDYDYEKILVEKKQKRKIDEDIKPLHFYRKEELTKMFENFFGEDMSYHFARYFFVHKVSNKESVPDELIEKYAYIKETEEANEAS
ncbi:enoyl-CoA hydratase-related protein [Flavobacterium sp. H122]|uniref:enoyl-CoA hydratase-related protein n=1 Tax=Flavobacterium sp. H122 TaxID=2529860 RepID=UPI0010AAB45F|nr:enoyl-CoA hydratase-related protein [Flavobacterium sp. H122]